MNQYYSFLCNLNFQRRYHVLTVMFLLFSVFLSFPALAEPESTTTSSPAPVVTSSSAVATPEPSATVMPSQGQKAMKHSAKSSASPTGIRSYSSIHTKEPYIAMTFDDGPSATLTPKLLDLLKERGIKVTFFVIGEHAQEHPEILARAAAEGHEIANHTWNHPSLPKLSDAVVRDQVSKTTDVIVKATGKKPALLRPPYGAVNQRIKHLLEQDYGIKTVTWSVDPNDWKRPGASVVSQRILAGARPGAIVLSHDIHPGTIEAMPATLDALKAKGYKFVTVSELIALENKTPASTPSATPSPSPQETPAKESQ